MKQTISQKIVVRLLICALIAGIFWIMPFLNHVAFAEEAIPPIVTEPNYQNDPKITNLWAINSMPAPNGLVDYTVFYGNAGILAVPNVTLTIDYDESKLYDVSLGDETNCRDDRNTVTCTFNTLEPQFYGTVGFTARATPSAAADTIITTNATIQAEGDENVQNNHQNIIVTVTAPENGGLLSSGTVLGGAGGVQGSEKLKEPAAREGVTIFNVQNNPDWQSDALSTAGLKFMIRGKEALAWSLNIKDSGFHNPAIQTSYLKVLTIVNSLFIIGLLAIAAMWMFSLLIPRRYLRQVILVYGLAVLFVNFALPLNQLFIDGTTLLQKTFMSGLDITSIVDTPNYNDPNALGYQSKIGSLKQAAPNKMEIKVGGAPDAEINDQIIGKLQQDFLTPSLIGTLTSKDSKPQTIELSPTTNSPILRLNSKQTFELVSEKIFNPNEEHLFYAFLMLLFTGMAYFGMALIFIFRIVILWALMIVSPVLFLLAVFRSTRSYFYNWLGIYARWLLIGPLMALGIMIVVGIWKATGLPVTSSYLGSSQFGNLSNIGFYLPGKDVINSLSTTPQMMEYLLFLVMLYLPIFFSFMLTRQKMLTSAVTLVSERRESERARPVTQATTVEGVARTLTPVERAKELTSSFGGFLGAGLAKMTKTATPMSLRTTEERALPLGISTSMLPEQLALANTRDLLGAVAGSTGSRNAHSRAIEKLASPETILDPRERENVIAVRNEVSERAARGDAEATVILNEINTQKTPTSVATERPTAEPTGSQGTTMIQPEIKIETEELAKAIAELPKQKQDTGIGTQDSAKREFSPDVEMEKEDEEENDEKMKERKGRQKKKTKPNPDHE